MALHRPLVFAALLTMASPPPPGGAATYVVDRNDDSPAFTACTAAPLDCSLRGAILNSNASPFSDTIEFDLGLVPAIGLFIPRVGSDSPEEGDLDITRGVAIQGGSGVIIFAGDGFNDRIFDVDVDADPIQHVLLSDLIVLGGDVTAWNECGGGIRLVDGALTLTRVEVTRGGAVSGGGICDHFDGFPSPEILTLERSSVTENTATSFGGGLAVGSVTDIDLVQSTISGNSAPLGGAAFFSNPDLITVEYSTFADNTTSDPQGGDVTLNPPFNGVMVIEGSVIDGDCLDPDSQIASLGGNVEGPGDTCGLNPNEDQIGVADLRLEPLAFGGNVVTRSHRPRWNSPAVDDPLGVINECPATDQRLQPRPQDGNGDGIVACDSGSVEAPTALFIDGFETGDTSRWSVTVP